MKEGWEYKKLGEICDFRSGFAFKSNKFTKIGEPIIRISDIQNEEIDDSNLVYFDPKSYTEDLSKYLIYPDDILIAMSGGTTGKIGINTSNRTYYLNQRVGVFRENKKYLNHRYLFYFLHTKSEESLKIAAGAAQPNLSTAQIKSFLIPVPSLSEQQSIVDYLDSAFAKIDAMKANAEKAINEGKALFQASLKEMLEPQEGWEEKKLGDICDFRSGFAFKSNKFTKIGEPIIRISDIQNEEIDDSNLVYFDSKSYTEDLSKYLIYPDDILIAMSGGTTGKLGINTSNRTFYLNQRVGVFRENKSYLNHRYLYHYLHTKSEESLRIAAGAAQPNLSTAQIKSFIIPVPSLSEQQSIVETLDSLKSKVDHLQANYDKISQECDALKQAILRQVFE